MGNKRKESSIEDRDPNRIKRKKSSNNDDSSGSSGPSAPFGPTSDSNVPDTGNSESRENDLSKIIIGKIAFLLREMKRVLTDFIDKILQQFYCQYFYPLICYYFLKDKILYLFDL